MSATIKPLPARTAPLPEGVTHYEFTYAQPRLGTDMEVVIWERKREQINAKDDEEATRLMCEFLGQDALELRGSIHPRAAISLTAVRPVWRIVREWGQPRVLAS